MPENSSWWYGFVFDLAVSPAMVYILILWPWFQYFSTGVEQDLISVRLSNYMYLAHKKESMNSSSDCSTGCFGWLHVPGSFMEVGTWNKLELISAVKEDCKFYWRSFSWNKIIEIDLNPWEVQFKGWELEIDSNSIVEQDSVHKHAFRGVLFIHIYTYYNMLFYYYMTTEVIVHWTRKSLKLLYISYTNVATWWQDWRIQINGIWLIKDRCYMG